MPFTHNKCRNGPDQCGIICKHCIKIKGKSDWKIFTTHCVRNISSHLGNKQLLYVSKHECRIYVGVTFSFTFWKFARRIATIPSPRTEYEIDRPALYYMDFPDSCFEVELSFGIMNEIECESSHEVTLYFDIQRKAFADDMFENASYKDIIKMLRRESDDRPQRSVGGEKRTGRMLSPVNISTLEDVTSTRPVNKENLMEIDRPDTVATVNGETLRDFVYTRTENADPFSQVYGSTLGNAPLATPSTGVAEQLSMDQYPSYKPQSYMSMLKQQQFDDKGLSHKSNAAYKIYDTAIQRKASFTASWPHPASVQDVDEMVKNGFFYTGDGDLIKCFYCGIGLKDWSDADDPVVEHVRYAPDCQFLIDTVPPTLLTRIKASRLPNTIVSTRESVSKGGAERATPSDSSARPNDEVMLSVRPRNPQYRLKSVRISSFSKWPQGIIQTPEELAEAGFFYTGCGDRVRCYACDGGLQKWSPEDNAWVEHARWFHHCAYLIQVKGQDFVDLVRLSVEHQRLEEEGASNFGESGQEVKSNESSECMHWKNDRNSSEQDVEMTMKHEPQTAEELEAETEQLRSVIKCLICEENDANCLYLPCAHHRLCVQCSTNITLCPICQRKIHSKVKTFMS